MHAADTPHICSDGFSIADGGPVQRLLVQLRLRDRNNERIARCAILLPLLSWVPLLVLTALEGSAAGNAVAIPFLYDIAIYTRFLVALPILIVAEIIVRPRLITATQQFVTRDLVRKADLPDVDAIISRLIKLRDSVFCEALIVALALGGSLYFSWLTEARTASWRLLSPEHGVRHVTWAGWWFVLISRPVYQFFFYRWIFRVFLWFLFLRRMSKFDLDLVASHPDRFGGLGFLTTAQTSFAPIVFAVGVVTAGTFGTNLVFDTAPGGERAALMALRIPIATLGILILILFSGPLLLFGRLLKKCRRAALIRYGGFAMEYVRQFDQKWIAGKPPESPLGHADIQSLADLDSSYTIVQEMQTMLIGKRMILTLLAAFLVPMAPLLLTIMPFEELMNAAVKLVF